MLVGLCVTPLALLLAVFSAGAGHGDYVLARLLYPLPMLATLLTGNMITSLSMGLAVAQFPAYGAFVAAGRRTQWLALGALHGVAAAATFSGALADF